MLQRKALTANDFANLETVAQRLYKFERYYESIAQPFEGEVQSVGKLRRADLNALIARMRSRYERLNELKLAA